jgi:hypothetical protein
MGLQEVRWTREALNEQRIITLLYGKGNENHQSQIGSFAR